MKKKIKGLIACEYSGIVRSAFESKGFDMTSCDMLPTDIPGTHYIGNVMDIIDSGFDFMIGFPPCTYLTYAGMSNWYDYGRAEKRIEAAKFFMLLYNCSISYVAIENPRGIMTKIFRECDQEIHPYYFGDNNMKRTQLWLKNIPKLEYQLQPDLFNSEIDTIQKPQPNQIQIMKSTGRKKNRYFTDSFKRYELKTGHERSKIFPSIANAMADQWSGYLIKELRNQE